MSAAHVIVANDVRWARRVLRRTTRRYPWLRADIESEGLIGLHQAAVAFREGGVTFRAFAYSRVLGAASDWLRLQAVRVSQRTPKKRTGREVGGWDCDTLPTDDMARPEEDIDRRRQRAWLSTALAQLPSRRVASMVSMRIYGEKTLRDIGRAHGVTESAACLATGGAIRTLLKAVAP